MGNFPEDGTLWASSSENFYLRKYTAPIIQEDGSENQELINEALSILTFVKGKQSPHGIRINQGKKQQIIRNFKDEESGLQVIYGKFSQGGSCIINAGKCVIIATFNEMEGHTSAGCNEIIHHMARYLNKSTWPIKPEEDSTTWQSYIDKYLLEKGNILQALICSNIDTTLLASTDNFKLLTYSAEIPQEDGSEKTETVNEGANLIQLMKGSKPSQGLRINNIKYQIVRTFTDESTGCYVVYGKKAQNGCVVISVLSLLVIALYDEKLGHTTAACSAILVELAAHLIKNKK